MLVDMTLVIPAYNEHHRLPATLNAINPYLSSNCRIFEIIVVDDGSHPPLEHAPLPAQTTLGTIRYARHATNCGKGAAIMTGLRIARGRLVLILDADGATPIAEEARLRSAIERGMHIVVGSRLRRSEEQSVRRSLCRRCLGWIFASIVHIAFRLPVRDTQCGFKMLRGETAKQLAAYCCEPGYLCDLEMLLWAQRLGYAISEVPVSWHEVAGSKLHLFRDGFRMCRGLWRLLRLRSRGRPYWCAPVARG